MRHLVLALAGLVLLPIAARADTFTVTGTVSGISGTGTLTGTSNGNGSYTITSVSGPSYLGTINVLAPGSFDGNDNYFFPNSANLFDANGLAFSGDLFGTVDLRFNGSQIVAEGLDTDSDPFSQPLELSVAATPEPSSLLLSLTGLFGGAATLVRRRIRSSSSALAA